MRGLHARPLGPWNWGNEPLGGLPSQVCNRGSLYWKDSRSHRGDEDGLLKVAYQLEDIPAAEIRGPGFKATVKLWGRVVIGLGRNVPLTYVTNEGLEATYKRETDTALGKLVSNTSVAYDASSNRISFKNTMIIESPFASAPKTAIGVKVASDKPVPVLVGEIIYPELGGRIGSNGYLAQSVKIVIEIEPEAPPPVLRPVPVQEPQPVRLPAPQPERDWIWYGIAAGAIVAATAIVVGTIVEDFVTLGAGVADDPASFAAAAAIVGAVFVAPEITEGQPVGQQ